MTNLTDAQWQTIESLFDALGYGVTYDPAYGATAREKVVFTADTVADFGTVEDENEQDGIKAYSLRRGRKMVYVADLGDIRLCDGDITR